MRLISEDLVLFRAFIGFDTVRADARQTHRVPLLLPLAACGKSPDFVSKHVTSEMFQTS